jgi:hypothetical protein
MLANVRRLVLGRFGDLCPMKTRCQFGDLIQVVLCLGPLAGVQAAFQIDFDKLF